ncbi:MAG: C45 family peptidase [Planctomycetota bacterium]|jgi:hypothetical protein
MRSIIAILLIGVAAGYASWRILRPAPEAGPRSIRPAWTGARIEEAKGFTVLRLAGSPREKGRGHGERLRDRIQALLRRVQPADSGLAAFAIDTCGARIGPSLPDDYRAEIEGIAEGAQLRFEEILYLNTRFDLRAYELAGGKSGGIGFAASAAVGHGPEVVRRFERADLDGRPEDLVIFVHLDEVPTVLVGLPGMVGGFLGSYGSVDADRRGAALRPLQSAPTPVLTGLPWPLLLRSLLVTPPVPGKPLAARPTLDASLPYVLGPGRIGTVDLSPRGAVWHAGSGDFVAANPDALAGEGETVRSGRLDESRERLSRERARRVMAGQAPAAQVAVRIRASAGGVHVAVHRDGVRFLHSIRFRD